MFAIAVDSTYLDAITLVAMFYNDRLLFSISCVTAIEQIGDDFGTTVKLPIRTLAGGTFLVEFIVIIVIIIAIDRWARIVGPVEKITGDREHVPNKKENKQSHFNGNEYEIHQFFIHLPSPLPLICQKAEMFLPCGEKIKMDIIGDRTGFFSLGFGYKEIYPDSC